MGIDTSFGIKHLGGIMFLFCISLPLFFVPAVNAVSETYYADWNLPFDKDSVGFSYRVDVDFQTEANGKWILNNTYALTYTISITYVNQSYFNSENFYVQFFEPELSESGSGRNVDIVKNSCIVDQEKSGILVARFTPDPVFVHLDEECTTVYETLLHFKVYKNQEAIPYDYLVWQWRTDYSIPITFEEGPRKINFDTFRYAVILGATIIVASGIGYLIYRRRKKSREKEK